MRNLVAEVGASAFEVSELRPADLPLIEWAGNPAHVRGIAEKLDLASTGVLDYLVVRAPDGTPLAVGMVDYTSRVDSAEIGRLATRPELQGVGLGTRLISVAEKRIRKRGIRWSVIGVERGNDRAHALYERLGYASYDEERAAWEVEDESGNLHMHQADVTLMRKEIP